MQDVFFRIGGAHPGKATVSLLVDSSHVVLDDIWAWRADHGAGVGWTQNTAATGLVVNGDDVNATGLFVEHYQTRRGDLERPRRQRDLLPERDALRRAQPGRLDGRRRHQGYPAFTVTDAVQTFTGYGMGSYSFFNQHVDIYADNAFVVPTRPGVSMNDLLTIFLDARTEAAASCMSSTASADHRPARTRTPR